MGEDKDAREKKKKRCKGEEGGRDELSQVSPTTPPPLAQESARIRQREGFEVERKVKRILS